MAKRIDWLAVRTDYVEGRFTDAGLVWPTLGEVAAKFGCGQRAVEMRSAGEDWPKLRERFQALVATKRSEEKARVMARMAHKIAQLDEMFLAQLEMQVMLAQQQPNLSAEVAAGKAKGAAERQATMERADCWMVRRLGAIHAPSGKR